MHKGLQVQSPQEATNQCSSLSLSKQNQTPTKDSNYPSWVDQDVSTQPGEEQLEEGQHTLAEDGHGGLAHCACGHPLTPASLGQVSSRGE